MALDGRFDLARLDFDGPATAPFVEDGRDDPGVELDVPAQVKAICDVVGVVGDDRARAARVGADRRLDGVFEVESVPTVAEVEARVARLKARAAGLSGAVIDPATCARLRP